MSTARLSFDTSAAQAQLDDLTTLLKSRFPSGIPNQLISDFCGLISDVILTDGGSTVGTDGTVKVLQRLRFGSRFESLTAAILAGEFDVQEITPQSLQVEESAELQFGLSDSAGEVPGPLFDIMRQNSVALEDLTTKSHR